MITEFDLTPAEKEIFDRKKVRYGRKRVLQDIESRRVRAAIKALSPEKLAELQWRVENAEQIELEERERQAREKRERELIRLTAAERFKVAIASYGLPDISFLDGVHGRVAWRAWNVSDDGLLKSSSYSATWKHIMVADRLPSATNSHGLYCNSFSADNLMNTGYKVEGVNTVQGFIECRGHVVSHSDGVMRTEWARILCLVVVCETSACYDLRYKLMLENYFPIPVFFMTRVSYSELKLRMAFREKFEVGT